MLTSDFHENIFEKKSRFKQPFQELSGNGKYKCQKRGRLKVKVKVGVNSIPIRSGPFFHIEASINDPTSESLAQIELLQQIDLT